MRHVAANALTLLILGLVVVFGIVTWAQSRIARRGPLSGAAGLPGGARRGLASVADKLAGRGGDLEPDAVPDRGALCRASTRG